MTGFNTFEAFSAARVSARGMKGNILALTKRESGIFSLSVVVSWISVTNISVYYIKDLYRNSKISYVM